MLEALREDDRTGGVLDIDSPGGSTIVSDTLSGVAEVRPQEAGDRVWAWQLAWGATLACASSSIISQRSAVVGSIGVILIRPDMQELLAR